MTTSHTLSGKVAFVTGGSRGIGAAIVRRLAREGAAVAFTYASAAAKAQAVVAEVEAHGGRAMAIAADSADATALQNAIARTVKELGALDILVNNAGILMVRPLADFPLEDFDRMLAVNVRPVFVAAKAAEPHMTQGGRIIVIGSVTAERAGGPASGVYSMTKAAVAGLVRGLAHDFGPRGITINTVQPGPTESDMNPADGPHASRLKGIMALGRYGKDEEIASFVAYLAGPEAGFITGAALTIDGGYLA